MAINRFKRIIVVKTPKITKIIDSTYVSFVEVYSNLKFPNIAKNKI